MYNRKEELKREYTQKLARIEQEERNCCHEWEASIYNPEIKYVPYGIKIIGYAGNMWSEPEGYREEKIPRWSRRCKKCGKVEYTYKKKPVISCYEADFS